MKLQIGLFLLGCSIAYAQVQGGAAGGGRSGAGATGGTLGGATSGGLPGTTGRGTGTNTSPYGTNPQQPGMNRPIFISGKVMLSDGSTPADRVVIERVCNGNPRPEGYTDSKGRFSIQLGQNNSSMFADASVSNGSEAYGGMPSQTGRNTTPGLGSAGSNVNNPNGNGVSERMLMNCDIRAALSGYRSDVIPLSGRKSLDNPDVGVIILHRLAGVEGFATSMTTLMAPKDAKKAYDKARELQKKDKTAEAQKEFEKAVQIYPKYAVAWYDLGHLYQDQQKNGEAREAYQKAIAADGKYVSPYLQIALMDASEQKWQDVADNTGKAMRLNPIEFPQAFYYNSVANYNLKNYDEAEESARAVIKLDTQHRMPKAQHLLGIILAMKNDFPGAAENMKAYLQFAPQANDADMVRKQLSEIEKRLAQKDEAKQTPQQ